MPRRLAVPALLAGALLAAPLAEPNGGLARLTRVPIGPYLVSAWTRPSPPYPGPIDASVQVLRRATDDPELHATVRIRAEPVDRAGAIVSALLTRGAGLDSLLYHAEVELPEAGRWRVTVEVAAPEARGRAAFDLDVQRPGPPYRMIVYGGLALGLLVWAARIYRETWVRRH